MTSSITDIFFAIDPDITVNIKLSRAKDQPD